MPPSGIKSKARVSFLTSELLENKPIRNEILNSEQHSEQHSEQSQQQHEVFDDGVLVCNINGLLWAFESMEGSLMPGAQK